jgi:hypothetical protein
MISLTGFFKEIYRFIKYKNHRRRFFTEIKIRKAQDRIIKNQVLSNTRRLIIFLVPGANPLTGKDEISGGVLSIASLYEESSKLKDLHESKVLVATSPGEFLILRFTQFDNNITVYRFSQLFSYFNSLESLIIHIPELLVAPFLNSSANPYLTKLGSIPYVHINILNQNIRMMPEPEVVQNLHSRCNLLTQTTAHERYTTKEVRDKWKIPLHKFSVFGSPERYVYTKLAEKMPLILISPDEKPFKLKTLKILETHLPTLDQLVIRNLPYRRYLEIIQKAKYAITFGEGLDFYFLETVFSGGVGIAVYNQDFFPHDWRDLQGIFLSEDELILGLPDFMKLLEQSPEYYKEVHKQQYQAACSLYSYDQYRENIASFYRGEYSFK